MSTVRGSGLIREFATIPCPGGPLQQRAHFRRDALDLIAHEDQLNATYCYHIVPLDEPPNTYLRDGGEILDAMRLVPENGQLTAVAAAICTLGPALEQRITALFAERRTSLALALDSLGNELPFALTPVPGGVGPMTIAYLLLNTVRAACTQRGLPNPNV
jgi:Tetrahydrofolate dehydrogenase/cyclohydrolase, NAD(P)-binding domain